MQRRFAFSSVMWQIACMFVQCEHHLLPFYGVAHVVCIVGCTGATLAAREAQALVARFSKRLQVQVLLPLCSECFISQHAPLSRHQTLQSVSQRQSENVSVFVYKSLAAAAGRPMPMHRL